MHAYTKYALNLPEIYLHNIVGNRNIKITSNVYGKSFNFCNLIYRLMFENNHLGRFIVGYTVENLILRYT